MGWGGLEGMTPSHPGIGDWLLGASSECFLSTRHEQVIVLGLSCPCGSRPVVRQGIQAVGTQVGEGWVGMDFGVIRFPGEVDAGGLQSGPRREIGREWWGSTRG